MVTKKQPLLNPTASLQQQKVYQGTPASSASKWLASAAVLIQTALRRLVTLKCAIVSVKNVPIILRCICTVRSYLCGILFVSVPKYSIRANVAGIQMIGGPCRIESNCVAACGNWKMVHFAGDELADNSTLHLYSQKSSLRESLCQSTKVEHSHERRPHPNDLPALPHRVKHRYRV